MLAVPRLRGDAKLHELAAFRRGQSASQHGAKREGRRQDPSTFRKLVAIEDDVVVYDEFRFGHQSLRPVAAKRDVQDPLEEKDGALSSPPQ
jgi:hypothetical protein